MPDLMPVDNEDGIVEEGLVPIDVDDGLAGLTGLPKRGL